MNTHPDIFGLDPMPFSFPAHGYKHGPHDDPYVKETTKVAEIKDRFMKTRYKVALTEYEDHLLHPDIFFQVTVISFNYEDPLEVIHKDFDDYDKAVAFFEKTVDEFQALAKLDSRDAQNIKIYADKTEYHRIDPDCCRNCKWAKPADKRNCLFKEWRGRLRGKFFCMNSELYSKCMPGPIDGEAWHIIDITPEVDPDGICVGYERRPAETIPCPPPRPLPPGPPPGPPPHPYIPGPLPYGRP